jgi:hypothetical protein
MTYEMLPLNYYFSEDYDLLYELCQKQIIICFIDSNSYEENQNEEALSFIIIFKTTSFM